MRLQTGDPAGALVLLDNAEQAGQDVALPRAEALAALGRRREAIRTLESAVARKPGDAEIAFALAGYLVAEGRPALARAALERIQPFLGAGGPRTRLVLAQAETYRVEGRYGRALDLVQTAMRLSPGEPGLHRQAAELYENLKRPHEALHEVETAVSLSGQPADPGDPGVDGAAPDGHRHRDDAGARPGPRSRGARATRRRLRAPRATPGSGPIARCG